MRRVATMVLLTVALLTALGAPGADADARVGFWRSAGLRGVDAFGVYRAGTARARLSVRLRDTRKDRYRPAVRFTFTERRHRASVRLVALPRGRVRAAWRTVASANTGHLDVQECAGAWHGRRFRISRCAGKRRRY